MQRIISLSSRGAPRSLARLPVFGSAAASLPACSRLLAPSSILAARNRTPSYTRFLTSEAVAYKPVQQLESQSIDPRTDLHASKDTQNSSEPTDPEYVPVPYSSYTNIHQKTKAAIEKLMKFKTASKVQHQIISRLPIEKDIMIKAKTGTGKTTAFLVPAIESLLREYEQNPMRKSHGRAVGCLIVSPTRELAKQIAAEAEKLVKFHGWNVQSLVGGERPRDQLNSLARNRSDIVIGTPGRILDFLENQPTFQDLASKTKLLIFDECDVLLQMGFRREIDEIINRVPTDRQTFLVSATIDKKIKELAPTVFHRGFDFIDCVEKGETNTHQNVKQEYVAVEASQHFPVLCDIMQTHISKNKEDGHGSKIIVFMPTTKCADVYAQMIRALMKKGQQSSDSPRRDNRGYGKRGFQQQRRQSPAGDTVEVFMLHGKMSQDARSRISDKFRNSPADARTTSILVTTDVSARGVDYPNVSMVVQVGIPTETEAYIHRLGRTGRAGRSGEGVILLNSMETKFLRNLKNIPIVPSEKYTPEYIQSIANFSGESLSHMAARWEAASMYADVDRVQDAFVSLVGFYQGHLDLIGDPAARSVIDSSAELLKPFGAPQPPLPRALRDSLGLDRKPKPSRNGNNRRGDGRFGNRNDRYSERSFGMSNSGYSSSHRSPRGFDGRRGNNSYNSYNDHGSFRDSASANASASTESSGFGDYERRPNISSEGQNYQKRRSFEKNREPSYDRATQHRNSTAKAPWQVRGSVKKNRQW
ncbi:hypothetical protein GGI12_002075 [Dipsacomyces acuminosporus]|nr:hypothetical protein GGI12_002075 [Dipsacomyces acuminosporus]